MVKDKIIVITGANSGIGFATTMQLAKQGAHIIMACRNHQRGEKALRKIKDKTAGNVELMLLDLANFDSIRQFVKEFKEKYDHLDVLINNAGVLQLFYGETTNNFERNFQINYLGHFLLTLELLDSLNAAPQGRVIMLSSCAQSWTYIHYNNLNLKNHYLWTTAYGQSKLANLMFARELSSRLAILNTKITINALHPGLVATHIVANRKYHIGYGISFLSHLVLISPNKGARTSVYLAGSEDVDSSSGKFYYKCKEKEPSTNAKDQASCKRLFDLSCDLTNTNYNDIIHRLK